MQSENNLVIFIIGAMMGGILVALIISLTYGLTPIFKNLVNGRENKLRVKYNKLASELDKLSNDVEHVSELVDSVVTDYCQAQVKYLDLIALQLILFNTPIFGIRFNYVYDDEYYRKTGKFSELKDITFNIDKEYKSIDKIYNDIKSGHFNYYSDLYSIQKHDELYIMESNEGDEYLEEDNIINVVVHIVTKMSKIK